MLISSKNRLLHMQITADSIGVYTKVFSLSPYQNFDVIRQWSVQWCLMSGPSCLYRMYLNQSVIPPSETGVMMLCQLKLLALETSVQIHDSSCMQTVLNRFNTFKQPYLCVTTVVSRRKQRTTYEKLFTFSNIYNSPAVIT